MSAFNQTLTAIMVAGTSIMNTWTPLFQEWKGSAVSLAQNSYDHPNFYNCVGTVFAIVVMIQVLRHYQRLAQKYTSTLRDVTAVTELQKDINKATLERIKKLEKSMSHLEKTLSERMEKLEIAVHVASKLKTRVDDLTHIINQLKIEVQTLSLSAENPKQPETQLQINPVISHPFIDEYEEASPLPSSDEENDSDSSYQPSEESEDESDVDQVSAKDKLHTDKIKLKLKSKEASGSSSTNVGGVVACLYFKKSTKTTHVYAGDGYKDIHISKSALPEPCDRIMMNLANEPQSGFTDGNDKFLCETLTFMAAKTNVLKYQNAKGKLNIYVPNYLADTWKEIPQKIYLAFKTVN
jgi:hypothetical protein